MEGMPLEQTHAAPYSHTLIDSGVDWITATRPNDDEAWRFEQLAQDLLQEQVGAGKEVKRATLRDYTGWRGEHLFVGMREQDSIIVASQDVSARHWKPVSLAARNVSRLDVQASVWTHGEQPQLARWSYQKLRRSPPKRGRPRSYTLIQTHPHGETLNVGKRQSDAYGRLYDWSSAHGQDIPQTIWRYEVEYKRSYALAHSRALSAVDDPRTSAAELVHRWFTSKGLQLPWSVAESRLSNGVDMRSPERDTLAWFRSSLSKTVRRAIERHGAQAVVDALGLSNVVTLKKRR
jgi:hypothetical protein